MFSPQIHIVFNCEEEGRITRPIINNSPNKLYYFLAFIKRTQQKDTNLHFYEKNISILKKIIPLLGIIQKEVDYTNYIEIIQEISKIIKAEKIDNPNCKIFINVSSGSKMTSIASIEASKIWDCEVYYVFSTNYDPHGGGARHKGEFYIESPITFPINKPKEIHVKTLKLIEELTVEKYSNKIYDENKTKFIYMKKLIEELESRQIIELKRKHRDPRNKKSALYMKINKFLEPLIKNLEYIIISDDRRNKKVYLTSKGKNINQIFKFLI